MGDIGSLRSEIYRLEEEIRELQKEREMDDTLSNQFKYCGRVNE
ncbi:hypothetical protein SAMN04487830_12248 [Pseudobutyrivibrio sp. OR37]|nr:hypothetical protein [Pseudobutyrivibrio sp. OR37]SFI10184.1 hypothetical protein SAMN04487830_12248 [Pseudobutyrivibrio sp. OR37]